MFKRLSVVGGGLISRKATVASDDGGIQYNIDDVNGVVITDAEGTLYDDGGPDGPYGTGYYQTTIQAAAGTQIKLTLKEFEMGDSAGPGGRSGYEKLRIFNGVEGMRLYFGSGTTCDVPLGEETTSQVGGSLTIRMDNAGKYGVGGYFGTDDAGFEIKWETL